MKIQPVNENNVMISFSEQISASVSTEVAQAYQRFKDDKSGFIIDVIPSYCTLLVSCDLRKTGLRAFIAYLQQGMASLPALQTRNDSSKRIILPVYYGDEVALDKEEICQHSQLPFEEVIKLHSEQIYRVYAIGFAPGFAFLGNVDTRIAMPRKANPRQAVPQGSVAIADSQTAVYPQQSPGGWQIIGRTPTPLFDANARNLCPFEMGAEVQFEVIDKATFLSMGGQCDAPKESL